MSERIDYLASVYCTEGMSQQVLELGRRTEELQQVIKVQLPNLQDAAKVNESRFSNASWHLRWCMHHTTVLRLLEVKIICGLYRAWLCCLKSGVLHCLRCCLQVLIQMGTRFLQCPFWMNVSGVMVCLNSTEHLCLDTWEMYLLTLRFCYFLYSSLKWSLNVVIY